MGSPKQTLGYPSRTAAVAALRQSGLSTQQIANRIGIEPKTVSALEADQRRTRAATATIPSGVVFPLSVRLRLRPAAARRSMSVEQLMVEMMERIADDCLVDAILDDGVRS